MSPLSRREFVAAGVAAGAGLVIGFYLPHRNSSAERHIRAQCLFEDHARRKDYDRSRAF